MSEQNTNSLFKEQDKQEVNIKDLLIHYLLHWQWMAISIFICTVIAFSYLNTQTTQYKSKAKVLIKDSESSGVSSNMSIFEDLGLSSGNVNLENEMELFQSLTLLKQVSKELKLNIQIRLKDAENYPSLFESPISLHSSINDSLLYNQEVDWSLKIKSANTFSLQEESDYEEFGTFTFGKAFDSKIGKIVIEKTDSYQPNKFASKLFSVKILPLQMQALELQEKIKIIAVNENSSVLRISLEGPNIDENNAIINMLILLHEKNEIDDKSAITKTTSDFINERMAVITEELSLVEIKGQNYKTAKNLTDLSSDAQLFIEKNKELESKITQASIQLELTEYMAVYLAKQTEYGVLLPSNLGFQDPSIPATILQYNTKALERNRLLKASNENNPVIKSMKEELSGIKVSLSASLNNMRSSLQIEVKALKSKERLNKSKIASIPEYEREYRSIARQQQIKENLYLYLLQKREENEISMAATLGNTIIIDNPYSNGLSVSPNKKIAFLSALFLGLLIPIGIIYLNDLLDNKIRSTKDIEKTDLPFAGAIPENNSGNDLVVDTSQRSAISEAFRMLRTNMNFLLYEKKEGAKVIAVTSSVKGEGKTFIAYNLAVSISLTHKKVLIIGMDLRAPKLTKLLDRSLSTGVTNYLINHQITHQEIINQHEEYTSLSFILSGPIPPNPSELLHSLRTKELIDSIRHDYDYIIIDTAPIGMVADTQLITPHVDLTLYIARANFADKRLMQIPKKLHTTSKIKNIAIVLNDMKDQNKRNYYGYSYGYGYGYGYGDDYGHDDENNKRKSFFRRIARLYSK